MAIRSLVIGVLLLGVLFSAAFEDIYIRSIESQPPTQSALVQNCDPGGKAPTYVTVKVWTPNPFNESTHALFFYKNFTTGGWVQIYDCSVLAFGKECQVHLPIYLGGMGEKTESLELMYASMQKGSTKYEATFTMSMNHLETDKEKITDNKTAVYSTLLAEAGSHSFCNSDRSLCCKLQNDYSSLTGLENRSAALQKECRVDEARIMIESAINNLTAINNDASSCSSALAQIAEAESTATTRGCDSGTVSSAIDALKTGVRGGNYDLSLASLNSAMSSQCGGATVNETGTGGTGTAGNGTEGTGGGTGTEGTGGTQGTGSSSGTSKPICPGMFILFLLPLALMVYPKWDF